MARTPVHKRVVDLPPEMQSFNALNAYEVGRDDARVACQLSDVHEEIGEVAILRISMTSLAVQVEDVFDEFAMAFHSVRARREILLEIGGVVRLHAGTIWRSDLLNSSFLIGAYSLEKCEDFVFGDDGQIWRFDDASTWSRDTVAASDRIFDMHGLSPDRLYAVGGNGLILKSRGRTWDPIDVRIGTDFRCVLVENDRVFVAGDRGIAGYLGDNEFVQFDTGLDSDILSICSFRGSIYFADSDFGVHVLSAGAFEPVANLGYTYRLNAGEWLTAACGEYIFQFDGTNWRGIEISYNGGYRAEAYDTSFIK
ncbi:WD40/YVTN/BNR-like repeat-containing protein [Rhizobium ruizarguesonis]|uniref:WD40/YVTN/BNR-like repeat-containing protein n=1 Tax=Rhizobium ruizarguesonis TaxID=2081791 RepID=UPI0010300EF9|nr:hypothetical protein [Rhizobium ruizarguesonis]TAY85224.1 hypothetical protein ELH85_31810 [Rhizobium ruizarguesonis]TBA33421.1 hypothetical protein ELH62_30420 [Rhizobium ruizarguesonis]